MATNAELMTALRNADAAGDTEAATRIAGMIKQQKTPGYTAARKNQMDIASRYDDRPSKLLGGDFQKQMTRNLGVSDEMAYGGGYMAQGVNNLINRFQGKPITSTADEAGQAAADLDKEAGAQYAAEKPIANIGSMVAGAVASGRPTAAIGAATPLWKLAGGNMAQNLPFAFARQDGNLAERVPGAAKETAITGGLTLGLGALSNSLIRKASPASQRAGEFARANVRPTMAAINGGASAMVTKAISENLIAGGGARQNLQNSIDDVQREAQRIGGQYAIATSPEDAGNLVRSGVQRFAQSKAPIAGAPRLANTQSASFASKADALYDQAIQPILAREVAGAGQATARSTEGTLRDIAASVDNPKLAQIIQDPKLAKIAAALEENRPVKFGDLRELRTWVRTAQGDPALRKSISEAQLERLESSLTNDIYTSAQIIGGSEAASRLQRTDQFYRAGMERIKGALRPFGDTGAGGTSAYRKIINMAGTGGSQNTKALISLKRSLAPDEWRTVASTVINNLGTVKPSAASALEHEAFSISNFVNNYATLSPAGRRVLFGDVGGGGAKAAELAGALDNLAKVGKYQQGVEQFANNSGSGRSMQNVGMLGGAGVAITNPGTLPGFVAGLGVMVVTGEAMTNPAFVRWLTSAPKSGQTVSGARAALVRLGNIAARDPALMPIYTQLAGADQTQPGQQ